MRGHVGEWTMPSPLLEGTDATCVCDEGCSPQTWASLWAEFFLDQGLVSTGQEGHSPSFPGGSMQFKGWVVLFPGHRGLAPWGPRGAPSLWEKQRPKSGAWALEVFLEEGVRAGLGFPEHPMLCAASWPPLWTLSIPTHRHPLAGPHSQFGDRRAWHCHLCDLASLPSAAEEQKWGPAQAVLSRRRPQEPGC